LTNLKRDRDLALRCDLHGITPPGNTIASPSFGQAGRTIGWFNVPGSKFKGFVPKVPGPSGGSTFKVQGAHAKD
jgi:hypothetical protein